MTIILPTRAQCMRATQCLSAVKHDTTKKTTSWSIYIRLLRYDVINFYKTMNMYHHATDNILTIP